VSKQIIESVPQPLAVAPATPESILQQAIEAKLEPASMEKFYALFREMKADQAKAAFFNAMSEFRGKCSLIAKSKKATILTKSGSNFSFDYAPIEEVAATINPELSPLGLSFGFDEAHDVNGVTVTCIVMHRDGHEVRTTAWCPYDTDAKMSKANATTAAWTTARRKALMQAFGLVAADEKDAEAMMARQANSGETVTEEQAANLELSVENVGGDVKKFLAMLGVEKFTLIPLSKYGQALSAIEKKRKGAK
jgi:hypothetical protein